MRSVLRVFVLMLLVGCGPPQSVPVDLPHATQQIKLPEFVDDPEYGVNEDLAAPRQKLIFFRNLNAIDDCLKHDSVAVREEMLKRLSLSQPMSLRLIAATVLVLKKDEEGRKFFIAQSKVPQDVGDLYITFNYLAWLTKSLTGSEPDLSWAEDFMIEALQSRTRISLRDAVHYPRYIRSVEEMIEIREMAVRFGQFSDHLMRMHSEKALPVILSLLREFPFYGLESCIGQLGRYKDERVGPLLMDVLTNYRDSKRKDAYRFAVVAAADMNLKAAVPILLRHLNDEDSYYGLTALGDRSAIPAIKAALPRLKPEARAEAELALIHLKGGDVVPSLLQLLRREDYLKRSDVMTRLEELHDPRSVTAMTSALCHDKDWFVRWSAIRVLAAVKNKEAIQGLIGGLSCDYSKLQRPKTNSDHDFNGEYRGGIAKALKEITGEDFGVDQQRWAQWFSQQKAF